MTDCAVVFVRRNVVRFTLTGLVGIWLSGARPTASRFGEPMDNPFSNPFASASARRTPPDAERRLRAVAGVGQSQLCRGGARSPVAVAPARRRRPSTTGQIFSRPSAGPRFRRRLERGRRLAGHRRRRRQPRRALRRYGVPAAALLSANGLSSGSEVHGGMRLVVPGLQRARQGRRGFGRDPARGGRARAESRRREEGRTRSRRRYGADAEGERKGRRLRRNRRRGTDAEAEKAPFPRRARPQSRKGREGRKRRKGEDARAVRPAESPWPRPIRPRRRRRRRPRRSGARPGTCTGPGPRRPPPLTAQQADASGSLARIPLARARTHHPRLQGRAATTASTSPFPRAPRCAPPKTAPSPMPAAS